tara:strand:- start:1915 stop:2256 length:342 start_codon:yes stop_codon:yes gene_type:complete
MANTFKQATKSNLVTTAISSTDTNILTVGSSATCILLSSLVANKTSTNVNIDLYIVTNTGDDTYLLKNVPVPAGSSLELVSGSKIILESSDILRSRADAASAADITVSYLEQT